jgi:hypothetical protein
MTSLSSPLSGPAGAPTLGTVEAAEARREGVEPEAQPRRRRRGGAHSGRLLLRMPEALHAELARLSESEGVSLNSFINRVLESAAAGDRSPDAEAPDPAPPAPAKPTAPTGPDAGRSPLLRRLLVANLLVVAAVGVLAVVLLVTALR